MKFPSLRFLGARGNVVVMRLYRRLALLALIAAIPLVLRLTSPWRHRQPFLISSSWFRRTAVPETKQNTSADTSFSAAPPMQPVPIPADSLIAR